MDAYDYYKNKQSDIDWVEEFQSTSDKKSGKTFLYTNTNFRTIYAFSDIFKKFIEYNNKPITEWVTYEINGEVKAKHWTVRMQQSQFFRKDNGKYSLTAKGTVFGKLVDLIDNNAVSKEDAWILTYFLILNSYFGFNQNYIIKRTQEVYLALHDANYSALEIDELFEDVLKRKDELTINDLFKTDAFWLLTFFKDSDFIQLYKLTSASSKELLSNRVINERTNSETTDLIGHKYKNSGQYNISMFLDDLKMLYVTHSLISMDNRDPLSTIDNIASICSRFETVDIDFLKSFVSDNLPVFEVIFNEAIKNEDVDDEINNEGEEGTEDEVEEVDSIDPTTSENRQLLRSTRMILKRMAKSNAHYKCELEIMCNCSSHYFTSKEDNQNYLEIHHLIPWAFNNEFEATLEKIENYEALCPRCHMLLHHGIDRERKAALVFLYNSRKESLKNAGLDISLEQLFQFYQITDI